MVLWAAAWWPWAVGFGEDLMGRRLRDAASWGRLAGLHYPWERF
jgi:hypothetical protein